MIITTVVCLGFGLYFLKFIETDLAELQSFFDLAESELVDSQVSPNTSSAEVFRIRNIHLTYQKSFNQQELSQAIRSFTPQPTQPKVNQVDYYILTFEVPNQDQIFTKGQAQVFIPQTNQDLPLFVFGSGTTGLADKCAPSLEKVSVSNIGNYLNHMLAQASQGQAVIFPDYDGYHDVLTDHSYFVAEQEARIVWGAVKALDLVELQLENYPLINYKHIVLSGYSQGGHAALASALWLPALTPEYSLSGIIGYASAQNPQTLLYEAPALAPYLWYAFDQFYGFDHTSATDIFQESWHETLSTDVLDHCVDTIYNYYPNNTRNLYTAHFEDSLLNTDLAEFTEFKNLLEKNTPVPHLQVPIILIQGSADPIVTPQAQLNNLDLLCNAGNQVYYHLIDGANHFQIRQQSFAQTQTYLAGLYDANFINTSCQPE